MSERQETTQNGGATGPRDPFVVVAPKTDTVSPRGMLIGAAIFCAIAASGFWWRMASEPTTRDRLKEFDFTVQPPDRMKFEIPQPIRDIIQERTIAKPDDIVQSDDKPVIIPDDKPVPMETPVEPVVRQSVIAIDSQTLRVEKQPDVKYDAPEQIQEVSEQIEYAVVPIGVVRPNGGDFFKPSREAPPGAVARHFVNTAPRPGRGLVAIPRMMTQYQGPSVSGLPPLNVSISGGDFGRSMTRIGGLKARSAVDAALHWLATRQENDGYWASGPGPRAGTTSLALLSLMSGGHTARRGEYRRNVIRAMEWLLSHQHFSGQIGDAMDEHAIATIALCESFGRTPEERVGAAARKAVVFLEKSVSHDDGWGLRPNSTMSDLGVAAWAMQALKAARLAQIPVDQGVTARALLYLDSQTDRNGGPDTNGRVAANVKFQRGEASESNLTYTAAGMLTRQFSGVGVNSAVLTRGADWIRKTPPDWKEKDFAYWYYATYAMHNMGGEHRVWWNKRIRDVLLDHQTREGNDAGSWDPMGDASAKDGDRVATTALGALILEVYYRYSDALASFGVAPDLDELLFK